MNNPRRAFLSQLTFMAGVAALNKPLASVAAITKHINTLHTAKNAVTIYHTNDLHGNVDVVHENIGGLNQIKKLLKNEEINGLLLDAGNFINASNNLAQQKQVLYMMNSMGYHAAAIGNQELSSGEDHLASLIPLMKFTLVNCNLQFNNKLSSLVKPYIIINSGNFKTGITGVCSKVNGIKYNDAIKSANNVARLLKEDEKCDLIICLSHLGHKQEGDTPDNQKLAEQSENIDIIIGGDNRKLFKNAIVHRNKLKHEVILAQTAWNGLMMGRTIVNFDDKKQKNGIRAKHYIPGMPANQCYSVSFSDLQLIKKTPLAV